MLKTINQIFITTFIFFVLCYFFYYYENTYFLESNIFPFDSIVFKDMAISFFDGNYKNSIDYRSTLIYYPHNTKFIYPFLSGFVYKFTNFDLIQSMLIINLVSCYLSIILCVFLINKFIENFAISISIIFFFLIIWNAPLRLAFYNPSNAFAFDALLISSYTIAVFNLNQKNILNLIIIIILITALSLQRYVVSVFLVILPILLNNFKNYDFKKFSLKNKFTISAQDKIKLIILILVYIFHHS